MRSLSAATVLGLALLGAPRVVLHDLHAIDDLPAVTAVLAVAPPAIWILVARARRLSRPLRDLVKVGALFGVILATIHQLLWDRAYEDGPPRLGGELAGRLSSETEETIFRVYASISSVLVGVVLGVITGMIARWAIDRQGASGAP